MKETHYKLKHRVTALFAAAVMLCSILPGAAFAEEPTPQPTEETVQMEQQTELSETDNGQTDESSPDPGEDVTEATPETAEEQPAEEEISAAVVGAELYTDLPNAPIGSYIGSEGLPVATGETKIGISEWPESQLEEGGSYLTAAALDNDGLTMAVPLLDGADYAIVPIMAQVEYPADGSSTDMILPDGVTLLDFYGEPVADADALLHNSYHETSAAVMGVYVQAAADFTAQLVYTGPDGSTQTKTLYVTIDREHTVASPFADAGIAAYGERPIPDVTSGKITKVAKVNGTWLIWFNGDEAYCCTPGADGQPKNCPTYTYVNTLTEITAPNGYKVAESIDFTVLPTGEMQTVVMKDAREDTPTPTPDNTPTPDHTPQPTPNTTPAPTPVPAAPTATPTPLLTIPKTGDNSSLGLLLAIAGISLAGLAVLVHKSARRKDIAPRDDDDEDTED